MTGISPAQDTKFSSSNTAPSVRQLCDNLTESVLPIRVNPVLNKPITAAQGHFLHVPRRSAPQRVDGFRLSNGEGPDGCNVGVPQEDP